MKYCTKIILACALLFASTNAFAQYNRVRVDRKPLTMEVLQVDNMESSTIVYLKYTRTEGVPGISIADRTYARANGTYKQYRLIDGINIPVTSDAEPVSMLFDYPNQVHCFALEFEKMPAGASIDIIEDEQDPNAINFYSIRPDTTEVAELMDVDRMMDEYPMGRVRGMFVKNNTQFQYFRANDVVLTLYLEKTKEYGKYYTVNVNIQNMGSRNVMFSLNKVKAEGIVNSGKSSKVVPLTILSAEEYDKKVGKKQARSNRWYAWGEMGAAEDAAKKYTSTTYASNKKTTASSSTTARSGGKVERAHTTASANTTTRGTVKTQSYNGAAAYEARQIAKENIAHHEAEQAQKRQELIDGYIKDNAIHAQSEYSGFFNIEQKKVNQINLEFVIDGMSYPFVCEL